MIRGASIPGLSLVLAAVLAVPAAAEARQDVHRQRFVFPGNQLTIDVQATSPGTLRIARGGLGAVEVAGRASGGIAAMGLGGRGGGRLVLTALGGERADYLVTVPPDVMVRVLLPDRPVAESFGALRRDGSYSWSVDPVPALAVTAAAPPNVPAEPAPLLFQFYADGAPARVLLGGGHEIPILTVHREGGQFQIAADQPATAFEIADTLELLPDPGTDRMVITLPWDTGDFELVSERRGLLLRIDDGSATSICSPVTEQTLEGRIWYTFSLPPTPGSPCSAAAEPAVVPDLVTDPDPISAP